MKLLEIFDVRPTFTANDIKVGSQFSVHRPRFEPYIIHNVDVSNHRAKVYTTDEHGMYDPHDHPISALARDHSWKTFTDLISTLNDPSNNVKRLGRFSRVTMRSE